MLEKNRILYEDNHLIIVNKKVGELVQGDETGDRTLADDVKEYLKVTYNKITDDFLDLMKTRFLLQGISCSLDYSNQMSITVCSLENLPFLGKK